MAAKAMVFTPMTGGKAVQLDNAADWSEVLRNAGIQYTRQKAYRKLDVYHRCVEIIGGTVANIPWEVSDGSDDSVWSSAEPAPPSLAWIGDINMHLYLGASAIALEKCAYWYKDRNGAQPAGLRWLNPTTITAKIDPVRGITGFERWVNGRQEIIPAEDMVYVYAPDPYTELGRSENTDGEAARSAAEVLLHIDEFLKGYFSSGMVKAGMLKLHERATPQEVERVRRWYDKFLRGSKNSGYTAVVQSQALEYEAIGEGLADLKTAELSADMTRKVAAAFGIPVSMIDNNAANLATAREYTAMYYQSVAIPRARRIGHALNDQLLGQFGYELRFYPERMEIFQARELEKAQALAQLVGRVFTVNEARAYLDLDNMGEAYDSLSIGGGDGAPPAVNAAAIEEAKQWKRKVKSRGDRDVAFRCQHLSDAEQDAIKGRLSSGMDLDRTFSPPYVPF